MIDVKVYNNSENSLPKYESKLAAGCDVKANIDTVILAGESALIPTGLYVAIPEGYEIQVRPRSGLALKHGITVLNSPGTIDADYRGEIGVILVNHSHFAFPVNKGDRIGQLILNKVEQINWISANEKEDLSKTDRGEGGFGSTKI